MTESLRYRHWTGQHFSKPTVLRNRPDGWLVVGPGFDWLGDEYPTWEEAFQAAYNGR